MMMGVDLIGLLVVVIVVGLIYWSVHRLAAAFGLPAPIVSIIDIVIVFVFVFYVLRMFGWLDRI